ncbi:MAG: hypothetical protein WDZ69_00385 [Candidatus Pacearchaeota archaeon]
MKKFVSLLMLVTGLILLASSLKINITGFVIGTVIESNFNFILGMILMIISILILSKGSLEAIVIPTGGRKRNETRIKEALKEYFDKDERPYILATGRIGRDEEGKVSKNSQQYNIYKALRDKKLYGKSTGKGLKPSDMIIEGKSSDSLENFLYSIDKIKDKEVNNLLISTNPTQYWRFKLFENQAKKEGLIDESFRTKPVYTPESTKDFIYGILGFVKDYFRVKTSKSLEDARAKSWGREGIIKNTLERKNTQNH